MLKTCALLFPLAVLIACDAKSLASPKFDVVDKKIRQELFFRCLKSLPAGPASTKYNDWDEVIEECGDQAYRMTVVCVKNCG